MKKNICIVHYNTPTLTECLIKSINKFVDDAYVYIFDNSDEKPFTAQFDNVTILDNTHGQIIDFGAWLENYPDRYKSPGKVCDFGSAKHTYSIEKCMELINEPFILMDSDILLKKDVSDMYDESCAYVGEVITQPKSTVKRVLPFLCFINAPMCREHDAHYFNDNHMHGLRKTPVADRYDTGAAFYLETKNLPHKDIRVQEYAIHYAHGSWDKPGYKKKQEDHEWLTSHKNLWSDDTNKNVVYTCIVGDYDSLMDPEYITLGWDYICFTDNQDFTSDIWDIRPLPAETDELPQIKKQRYVKLNPHKLLQEYDISVWVDGNVKLLGDLNEFTEKHLQDDTPIYIPQHPARNDAYIEGKVCIAMKKDTKENIEPQMEKYKNEGFPRNYGLPQSNIILRKHNDEGCIRLMECWFSELKQHSHRDQLSFNYAMWKNEDVNVFYMDKKICNSEWFKWLTRHSRPKTADNRTTEDKPIQKRTIPMEKRKKEAIDKIRLAKLLKTTLYWT